MLGNGKRTVNQDIDIEDPRDADLGRGLLMSLDTPATERRPEKLEFLARALGDALDQLREAAPRDPGRRN